YSSAKNGSGNSGNIDTTANKSWGLYANGGNIAEAVRPFSAPLVAGNTFKIDMDNGTVNTPAQNGGAIGPGRVGFTLRSGLTNCLTFYFIGDDSQYRIDDGASTGFGTGIAYTDGGL